MQLLDNVLLVLKMAAGLRNKQHKPRNIRKNYKFSMKMVTKGQICNGAISRNK